MGLGQRPRPMLHFVLSRPKGLDEQRKYCPRMGIRIALQANTDSHPRDNIFWVPLSALIAEAHIECIYLAGSEVQIDTRVWVFQE